MLCNNLSISPLLLFPGNTPLHIAAGRRLKEIVALLMAYGANPALANGEGDFPTDLPASLLVSFSYLYLGFRYIVYLFPHHLPCNYSSVGRATKKFFIHVFL